MYIYLQCLVFQLAHTINDSNLFIFEKCDLSSFVFYLPASSVVPAATAPTVARGKPTPSPRPRPSPSPGRLLGGGGGGGLWAAPWAGEEKRTVNRRTTTRNTCDKRGFYNLEVWRCMNNRLFKWSGWNEIFCFCICAEIFANVHFGFFVKNCHQNINQRDPLVKNNMQAMKF